MQTFLPFDDFHKSALSLDNRRLGKQRVETLQIIQVLTGNYQKQGWRHHPAVLMWKDHELALCYYGFEICSVWQSKGYKDTCMDKIKVLRDSLVTPKFTMPWFIGNHTFHTSHKSNLIRKLPEHYKPQFPNVPNDLPYFWPTQH